jgi:hypothetical protein
MPSAAWILHNYPPVVLAGAEFAAHRINLWLLQHGWKVHVYIVGNADYPTEFEGVTISCVNNWYNLPIDASTVLLSQLWATRQARTIVDMKRLRYIEFVHYVDNTVISPYPWTTRRDFMMVYNSLDTEKRALEIGGWLRDVPSVRMSPIIVPPQITSVRTDPYITLVNFSGDKGADVCNACALKSDREFVGIAGSHGTQYTPDRVTIVPATQDMESVWAKTRILLIPSKYETWSMVASEALLRGIPVIAADHIPALRENCGDAALYVPREDIHAWLQAMDTIEQNYAEYSEKATHRKFDSEDALRKIFFI